MYKSFREITILRFRVRGKESSHPNMRKSKGGNGTMTQIWMNDEIALDARGDAGQSSYIHGNKLISSAYGWYL